MASTPARYALKDGLDRAVAPVAHPPAETELRCLALGPQAIAHALDAAFNACMDGSGGTGHAFPLLAVRRTSAWRGSPLRCSRELDDHRVDGEAVAGLGIDLLHGAVALGARMFSIFMASTTARLSPAFTSWPSPT